MEITNACVMICHVSQSNQELMMRRIHVPGPMQVGLRKMCRKEIIVSVNIEHGGKGLGGKVGGLAGI